MRILVLSDSHASLLFMRQCMDAVRPDAVIHLGDYFEDGRVLAEEKPQVSLYQVPGNCDQYREGGDSAPILCPMLGGVKLYLTHGHLHRVKLSRYSLLTAARQAGAAAVLYGHTHEPECRIEEDGLLVLNPGSCGYGGGSAAVLELTDGKIRNYRLLRQCDLEEMV